MHMRCLFVPIAVATLLIGGVALCGQTSAQASGGAAMVFTPTELRHLQILGPWPPPTRTDPSNRVSCQPRAVELGRRLFRDPRMSPVGYIACVTCHQPDRAFTDLKARAHGLRICRATRPVCSTSAIRSIWRKPPRVSQREFSLPLKKHMLLLI